jgi:molecular chaperone DnaK
VHQIRKALAEHGSALDAGEKEKIEAAIKDVEEALKGDDKEALESKTAAMMTASQKLGEKMYSSMQGAEAAAGAAAGAAGAGASAGEAKSAKNDDVVDADYKEVKRG